MDAIVSVTRDWAIGNDGRLIVRNRADMRRFVALTTGGTVVMGRTTFESFPGGPLKGRRNVVLSRSESYSPAGVEVVHSAAEALEAVSGDEHVWLIGGDSVYRQLLDACERVYVTKNDVAVEADAFFPDLDASPDWKVESVEEGGVTEAGVAYEFVTYVRAGRAPITGRAALEALAKRFPQLYVAPAEDAEELSKLARLRGVTLPDANLDHFTTTPEDELRVVDTPAGPVETLFLKNRADFETFLQIVSHQSQPVPIARTVGAITYRGLADWEVIRKEGLDGPYKSELIVISEGPYSNISAACTPYDEEGWVRVSRGIRLHHECAHVVCRRKLPNDILPIWDEITADVVGLLCATGRYDAKLAATFLGVGETGFSGGRLSEYLDEGQLARIDEIAVEVWGALEQLETLSHAAPHDPFVWLLDLKAAPLLNM